MASSEVFLRSGRREVSYQVDGIGMMVRRGTDLQGYRP